MKMAGSSIFILSSGVLIFLLLVVGSANGADVVGIAVEGQDCKYYKNNAETPGVVAGEVCTPSSGLICFKGAKAAPTAAGMEVAKVKDDTGKCYCDHDKKYEASMCKDKLKGHTESCAKADDCKTPLTCQTGGTAGTGGSPDKSGKIVDPTKPGAASVCLCPDNKVHKSGACNNEEKKTHSMDCAADGCKTPLTCQTGGTAGTGGYQDASGKILETGKSGTGKCLCPDNKVHLSGECKKALKHGMECGDEKCDQKFVCHVGGAISKDGKADTQGTKWEVGSAKKGLCLCGTKDMTINTYGEDCETVVLGRGPGPFQEQTTLSRSERLGYHSMSLLSILGIASLVVILI